MGFKRALLDLWPICLLQVTPKLVKDMCHIRPLFFLLPQVQKNQLRIKVYDDLIREKRSIDTSLVGGSTQKWGKDEWPPE